MKAHVKTWEDILKALNINLKTGLTSEEVIKNRETYGKNTFAKEKPVSFLRRILNSACEPMILMLIFAAFITLTVNIIRYFTGGEADFLECAGIFAAISISVIITVVMEGRSAKAFEALNKINEDALVKVLRNGTVQLVPQKLLAVGDIVYIETGDKITADGRLIETVSLHSDESSLTGESQEAEKDASFVCTDENTPVAERKNMLYSGCFITSGSGVMVVTNVGNRTEFGKIAQELSHEEKSSTPLQEKLDRLGKFITLLGASAAAVVFAIQVVLFIVNGTLSLDTVSEAFITSIILVVAAVPEGLPTIVAVSLSINIIKMSKQNALVKKMIACETIGCVNVICSDKTGTLTQNKMTVTEIYSNGKIYHSCEVQNPKLLRNFCLNSTADVSFNEGKPAYMGNPTECALMICATDSGHCYTNVREASAIAHVYPFSSELKNMTTIEKIHGTFTAYSKGSPEKILSMCNLPEKEAEKIEQKISSYQENARRVIAFSHKDFSEEINYETQREFVESDMIFDGFAAISDPLRKDVYDAVKRCQSAGISLKILTGDNIVTAKAIANELALLDNGGIAVEAKEIEKMTDEALAAALPEISVIARSTPSVKMRVVKTLKDMGDIVAVTGDGINDAPAIKNADVGIAMGITGTDVSKEASDIVLLDDSFSTIVKSVQWGRGIYENFQRFIQFQLTVNLSSVIVVLASILAGFSTPFTALQLLWINIVMDGPPALTLGLEPIRSDLMKQQPTPRNSNIITKAMLSRIIINGLFISLLFMAQHIFNFLGASREQMPTVLFTLFVMLQLFNAFNSRELSNTSIVKNLKNNKIMLIVFLITFNIQVLITQFGGAFFGTVPLSSAMWVKIIVLAFTVILASEGFKFIFRFFTSKEAPLNILSTVQNK